MAKSVEVRLFINGKFTPSSDGGRFPIKSPYSGETVAEVYEATGDDVNRAVAAAKAAFPAWSALSPTERGRPMAQLAAILETHHDELADLEALSMGRPVSGYFDSRSAAQIFKQYSEAGFNSRGISSLNTPGFVNMTFRQPYGVASAIIPWNVPLYFLAKKLAPALITGNTVVLKSSEKAPLTSLKLATLLNTAGFPAGVINIISGSGTSGAALASHMDVRVLCFTGSTRTGRIVHKTAAKSNLKRVISELGGKCPAIVFDDADIPDAVEGTQHSIQWNSGQTCMANSRIYVHRNISDSFIEKFKARFSSVHRGDPTDPTVNHGPQADEIQYKTVRQFVELGKQSGTLALGGVEMEGGFIPPTIYTETPEDAKIMREEVFGPVVNINTFEHEDDVIAKANDSEFGLYAALYTKDIDRALRMSQRLEAGTVAINCTSPTTAMDMPFGGYKGSGIGREGWAESLDNFLETKTVLIKYIYKLKKETSV